MNLKDILEIDDSISPEDKEFIFENAFDLFGKDLSKVSYQDCLNKLNIFYRENEKILSRFRNITR